MIIPSVSNKTKPNYSCNIAVKEGTLHVVLTGSE